MARRRRQVTPDEALFQLIFTPIALIILFATAFPATREWLLSLGRFVLGIVLIIVIIYLAIVACRYLDKREQEEMWSPGEFRKNPPPSRNTDVRPNVNAGSLHPDERYMPPDTSSTLTGTLDRVDAQLQSIPEKKEVPWSKPPARMPLVHKLRSIDWFQFEKLMEIVYRKQGYSVTRRGGANPDGGIDLVITDGAGERTAVQCKHWKQQDIGVRVVRELVGAMSDEKISRGVLATISDCTDDAQVLASRNRIEF